MLNCKQKLEDLQVVSFQSFFWRLVVTDWICVLLCWIVMDKKVFTWEEWNKGSGSEKTKIIKLCCCPEYRLPGILIGSECWWQHSTVQLWVAGSDPFLIGKDWTLWLMYDRPVHAKCVWCSWYSWQALSQITNRIVSEWSTFSKGSWKLSHFPPPAGQEGRWWWYRWPCPAATWTSHPFETAHKFPSIFVCVWSLLEELCNIIISAIFKISKIHLSVQRWKYTQHQKFYLHTGTALLAYKAVGFYSEFAKYY